MNTTRRIRHLAGTLASSCSALLALTRIPAMAASAWVPHYGARQSLRAWPQWAWWA